MKSLVLFNNNGGVGKTTLTFNLAHMAARTGHRCLLVDLDPQSNLTAIVLAEDDLERIWQESNAPGRTAASCVELVRKGMGDVEEPDLVPVAPDLWLLPGDLALSRFEQPLAEGWAQVLGVDNERALHTVTSFERLIHTAAAQVSADYVFVDVGPSLGSLNRAAILACDAVVVPLAPDLFSLQGLRNIGPTLVRWRADWGRVLDSRRHAGLAPLRSHPWRPIGYVIQQHLARSDRPVAAYERWAARIPHVFHREVLQEDAADPALGFERDPYCIAMLRHFASLMPLAQAARKPLFDLKAADGVGGGQIQAVARAREAIATLTHDVLARADATGPA